jgi:hypothetical protein
MGIEMNSMEIKRNPTKSLGKLQRICALQTQQDSTLNKLESIDTLLQTMLHGCNNLLAG